MFTGITNNPPKLSGLTYESVFLTPQKSNVNISGWAAVLGCSPSNSESGIRFLPCNGSTSPVYG